MEVTVKYIKDWCTTGTMTVDMDALFDIGMQRGGFSKSKCKKLIDFILENSDDETRMKILVYVYEQMNKKVNIKLCHLILDEAGEVYEDDNNL